MIHAASIAPERVQVAFRRPQGHNRLVASRVVCMAHPRRVAKVAKQIEREVGNLLITDKLLQAAVCPERRRGFDGALSALASVTEVHVTNDLQVAKVYVSLYSDDVGKATAMEGLQRLEGYVRKHIGKQVRLRLTPEIRFVRDDSIERSERIFKLLDQVKKIERGEAEPPPLAFYGDEDDDEDLEEDVFEDEGSFEVVDLGMFSHEHGGEAPSSSGRQAAGAPPAAAAAQQQQRQQQRQPRGGRQQQQQPPALRRGGDDKEEAGDDGDLEEMLAAFKAQVDARRGRQ